MHQIELVALGPKRAGKVCLVPAGALMDPTLARVSRSSNSPNQPCPQEAISKEMTMAYQNGAGFLLAVERGLLPPEATDWFDLAGLKPDFEIFCEQVVYCSFLTDAAGCWARGFVAEKSGEGEGFSSLAGIDRRFDVHRTIFINNFDRYGNALRGLAFFPVLAYFTGYLKADSALDLAGSGREATPAFRSFYAAMYELLAAGKLGRHVYRRLKDGDEERKYLEPIYNWTGGFWVPKAWGQLMDATKEFISQDYGLLKYAIPGRKRLLLEKRSDSDSFPFFWRKMALAGEEKKE